MRTVTVTFRGHERDVVIDRNSGYEPDTNAHEIEWHFDGVTPEEHERLALTGAEEQAINEQLATADPDDGER